METNTNFKEIEIFESIKIKDNGVYFDIIANFGQEEGIHVIFSPTLNVSGYGNTDKEARESFIHNMEVFVGDLFAMSKNQRESFLYSLGFRKQAHSNKIFSHLYVDENGNLCGLEQARSKKFNQELQIA